jgi:hypothetical protein
LTSDHWIKVESSEVRFTVCRDCLGIGKAISYVTSGAAAAVPQRKATAIVNVLARIIAHVHIILSLLYGEQKTQNPPRMVYLTRADGTVIGKFTEDDLRTRIASGDVSPSDQYLTEGAREWKPLRELPGAAFPASPPPLPTYRKKK